MGHRLIHIPHDESSDTLRELEVPKLDIETLRHWCFPNDTTDAVHIESVRPRGLMHLHDEVNRRILSFLVDEDGARKELPINTRASLLYGTHMHHIPVVGDVFIIAEVQELTPEGPDWVWQSVPAHITLGVISDAITESSRDPERFRL